MQTLTTSQLNYMLCIRMLTRAGTVRSTDISRQIGLSMPSVHHMLGTLEGLGLIEKHRHSITVTEAGHQALTHYDAALDAAAALLRELGLEDPREDALQLVTALSPTALAKIMERYS